MTGRTTREKPHDAAEEPPPLSAAEAAAAALQHVTKLTNRESQGATSVEPTDDGWKVEVEVVEDRHIPTSEDMLALYEVDIDLGGQLLSYRRTSRFVRGSGGIGERDTR